MSARNPEVDAWFDRYDNSLKPLVQQVRGIILDADPRIGEVEHANVRLSRQPGQFPAPGQALRERALPRGCHDSGDASDPRG